MVSECCAYGLAMFRHKNKHLVRVGERLYFGLLSSVLPDTDGNCADILSKISSGLMLKRHLDQLSLGSLLVQLQCPHLLI